MTRLAGHKIKDKVIMLLCRKTGNISGHRCGPTVPMMILFSWSYSLALSLPPLVGWGRFTPEVSGQSCAPDWREAEDVPYNVLLFTAGFFLPLSVILVTSLTVARILRQTTRSIVSTEIKAAAVRRQFNVLRMVNIQGNIKTHTN